MSLAYRIISLSLASRRIISSIPSTALMGVLISWDMLDKNTVLLLAAAWATLRSSSSSFSLFMSSMCAVISFVVATRVS